MDGPKTDLSRMEKKRADSEPPLMPQATKSPGTKMELQEFAPLDKLLKMLPQKAQKGLTNLGIEYLCVDANKDFIVLGSNIPIVFAFDRKEENLTKFKCDDKNCHISCVRILTCLDHQLAVGTTIGKVEVYLIPSKLPGRPKEVKKFVINGGHKGSVNCAEWSTNGMKLFTGDATGAVVYTGIDFYQNNYTPLKIINEDSPIIQLSYAYKMLIVSTYNRTVVCYTDDNYRVQQAGQQPRKSKGQFGAHFIPAVCKPKDAKFFAARSGLRMWRVDAEGRVLETVMYKELISASHKNIEVLPDLGLLNAIKPSLGDLQFGPLYIYMESYILSWTHNFLVILDPSGPGGAGVVASSQGKVGSIMSVAICEDEIFVLRRGAENPLIRIATKPDMGASKEHVRFSEEELGKLQQLNPPITLSEDQSKKTSKVTQSLKNFFTKAADELSEDAANFTKTMKMGALEIKQKAAQLKKETKDAPETIKEDGEEDTDDDDEEEDTDDVDKEEDQNLEDSTINSGLSDSYQESKPRSESKPSDFNPESKPRSESKPSDLNPESKPRSSSASIMSALTAGLQVAGLVGAGSGTPDKEDKSMEETLTAEEAKPDADEIHHKRFDEETLKKIGEEEYGDLIVQPKPVKKKKKKAKGAKKKETSTNASEPSISGSSENQNGNIASQDIQSPQVVLNVDTNYDKSRDGEHEKRTNDVLEQTNGASEQTNSASEQTQLQNEGLQPTVYQDITIGGSGAKSLVTPHGSVADQRDVDTTQEVHNVTLTNGGMVTALASSEPSKPRLGEFTVGSYPGEALEEGDLPGMLKSHQEEVRESSSDIDAPIRIEVASFVPSSEGNTLSAPAPQEFQIEEVVEDTTDKFMGVTDEHTEFPIGKIDSDPDSATSPISHSPPEEDFDFYRKYRTPTMLPEALEREEVVSSGESSADDIPIPENIQQKLAGSWMQCTVPGFITQLLVSDRNVWCVDNHDKIYHTLVNSVNYKWSRLKDSAMQVAVSPSESVVWRVHRRTGVAYASTPITPRSPVGSRWDVACKDVAFVCLDDSMAWIIKSNGQIIVHRHISRDRPFTKSIQVDSNMKIEQIAANRGVVWGLNTDKTVVYRMEITELKPQGRLWREVTDSFKLKAVSIALDGKNNGWAIDEDGVVWFRTGVTADTPQGIEDKWWQVPMGEYLMQDPHMLSGMLMNMTGTSAALERVDKVTGHVTSHVTGWLKKLSPIYRATHLAASGAGVWVCGSYHYKSTMHVSKGNLLGSRWEQAGPIGLPSSVIWSDVSANGVYANSGMIWALQKGGEVFCFPPDSRKPHLVEPPIGINFKQLSATPEAIWGLDDKGSIFIRMGVSQRHPHGIVWKKLDLNQLGARKVVHISCGSNVVWACDHEGGMHFRIGVIMPQTESLPPAWVPVDGKPAGYGHMFTQVSVGGPEDSCVWAVDNKRNVYVRKGICTNMPIGLEWEQVEGTNVLQICISSNNVWALCPNGDIACRFGVTQKNPVGDYWKKVPGNFAYLTVSQSDDIWAISSEGQLHQRFTKMFQRHQPGTTGTMASPDPDEWELL